MHYSYEKAHNFKVIGTGVCMCVLGTMCIMYVVMYVLGTVCVCVCLEPCVYVCAWNRGVCVCLEPCVYVCAWNRVCMCVLGRLPTMCAIFSYGGAEKRG